MYVCMLYVDMAYVCMCVCMATWVNQFPLSTVWVLGSNLSLQAWWQALLLPAPPLQLLFEFSFVLCF